MNEAIPMRRFFMLLILIAMVEGMLMVAIDPLMTSRGYPVWMRAMADAGMLVLICIPFMLVYQLRPMKQAYYDCLTSLPNRQLFHDRLEYALRMARREGGRCAVIFLDLDGFKPVNDHFGHGMGDMVLQQAALRIESCMRASDTLARIGGDEFAVLLPQAREAADVDRVVDKITGALKAPFQVGNEQISIGISAGVAFYPLDGEDGVALLAVADEAMYREKANKRNESTAVLAVQ